MMPTRLLPALSLCLSGLLLTWAGCASAASVALTGIMGSKALLVINGAPPKLMGAGQSSQGIRVLEVSREAAVVDIHGQPQTLRIGASPVSVGEGLATAGQRKLVLRANQGGHFRSDGQINGKTAHFMVDTGATFVSMSESDAQRLNVNYQDGQRVMLNTANGRTSGWHIRLQSVKLGDLLVHGVDAVVTPQNMPYVLLGNSFLSQLHMTRQGNEMVLEMR